MHISVGRGAIFSIDPANVKKKLRVNGNDSEHDVSIDVKTRKVLKYSCVIQGDKSVGTCYSTKNTRFEKRTVSNP